MGKYRWRTKLRSILPAWCVNFAAKGGRDCGDHEWYKSAENLYHCYRCQVGVRTTPPEHRQAQAPPANPTSNKVV
ncbi:hypothetical protein Adi01nite_77150 [Amorphoplanes digitatis]|uniref:Uncharacterized protein n=1 Tax=Actinoplanes digitatis TaxID=1868 RepID=A0A7W7I3B0_9ACTN|nr:hypothetical protein [Actinoplanes digitatis]BFE75513.1 hypothetical protein GCM10020092_088140 [Actinoplanes digitatis]GID98303.1 hypothetical protein Adi01nite_77150 [Actinoplanes digitatis]